MPRPTALLLLLVACGQPVEDCNWRPCKAPAVTEELGPSGALCQAFHEYSFCERQRQCGRAAPDVTCAEILRQTRYAGPAECWAQLRVGVDAGRLAFDGASAKSCLAALRAQSCDVSSTPPACSAAWTGLQAPGAACTASVECAGDGWCDVGATCPGVCRTKGRAGDVVRVAEGCTGTLAAVELADGGWSCRRPATPGTPCHEPGLGVSGTACSDPGSWCLPPRDGGVATCEPRALPAPPKRGEACDRSRLCQMGLACRADGRCGDLFSPGADCTSDFNGCSRGFTCGTSGRCEARPRVGAPCTSTCEAGASCRAGTCVAEGAVGAPCPCAFGLRCVSGVCTRPVCD